jgi:hypothetical protein
VRVAGSQDCKKLQTSDCLRSHHPQPNTGSASAAARVHCVMDQPGSDMEGTVYATPAELWASARAKNGDSDNPTGWWYKKAVEYWDGQEATDNGVLGGHGYLHDADIRDSKSFLKKVSRSTTWVGT